ncbi:peptide chain release factor N(5)-glutamine methyltransferase [Helicobacter cetorum]|uniref:peptide chain release factor N(5)-glutamine methyltransferase n=1 Tax=Helicobacter cetorum TaxID=138563 RepID=UPI000CF01F31|nr:peptide chain release factor N(5)-glutamine methyltransferase [Helicobacter cetorum]
MTISKALGHARQELAKEGFRGALESEKILSFVLNKERVFLHANSQMLLDEKEKERFFALVRKRRAYEPLEYLLKRCSFYGRDFYVNKNVLIPRPETEILVEKALHLINQYHLQDIGEIGIGSGCISISLALENPSISLLASDISKGALEVAQKNIDSYHLSERIKLVETNLWDNMPRIPELLISNPPYIARGYPLDKSVLKEPHNALFGGIKGDEILKEIIIQASDLHIRFLICEMGYNQQMSMQECLKACGYKAEFYKDWSSFDRGFIGILDS